MKLCWVCLVHEASWLGVMIQGLWLTNVCCLFSWRAIDITKTLLSKLTIPRMFSMALSAIALFFSSNSRDFGGGDARRGAMSHCWWNELLTGGKG